MNRYSVAVITSHLNPSNSSDAMKNAVVNHHNNIILFDCAHEFLLLTVQLTVRVRNVHIWNIDEINEPTVTLFWIAAYPNGIYRFYFIFYLAIKVNTVKVYSVVFFI